MSLQPEDIERQTFKERFKGYDMDEVDRFLDRVVQEVRALVQQRDTLLQRAEQGGRREPDETEALLRRTLVTAQRTADELVEEARHEAERIREEARRQAATERERLQEQVDELVEAFDQLRRFREDYRDRVHGVISQHLEMLEGAGDIPQVPAEMEAAAQQLKSSVLDPEEAAPESAREPETSSHDLGDVRSGDRAGGR